MICLVARSLVGIQQVHALRRERLGGAALEDFRGEQRLAVDRCDNLVARHFSFGRLRTRKSGALDVAFRDRRGLIRRLVGRAAAGRGDPSGGRVRVAAELSGLTTAESGVFPLGSVGVAFTDLARRRRTENADLPPWPDRADHSRRRPRGSPGETIDTAFGRSPGRMFECVDSCRANGSIRRSLGPVVPWIAAPVGGPKAGQRREERGGDYTRSA